MTFMSSRWSVTEQSTDPDPTSMKNPNNNPFINRQSVVTVQQKSAPERRRVSSGELFGAQDEIVIEHNSDEYRLRITRNDKLILTK